MRRFIDATIEHCFGSVNEEWTALSEGFAADTVTFVLGGLSEQRRNRPWVGLPEGAGRFWPAPLRRSAYRPTSLLASHRFGSAQNRQAKCPVISRTLH